MPSFVASPADAPRNPHKSREPDNLSAMVEVIDSINSAAAVAENVGLCWSRWHLAMGSGRNAAAMVKPKKYIGNRLTAPGASTEGSIGLRQGSRVSAPIAPGGLPGGPGGAFCAGSESQSDLGTTERAILTGTLGPLVSRQRRPHVPFMLINSKRLKKDCAAAQTALAGAGGVHRTTGATAIIEPLLPLIREFRAQKYSWAAIAAALAAQGVTQGADRSPITARRLTALISAINKRERRREDRFAGRAKRRDLAPLQANSHALALSTDLQRTDVATAMASDSEETIRHQEFEDRVRSLLKKDPI